MSVKVSAGTARNGGEIRVIAAVDPLAVAAADATNPRVDLVEMQGTTGVVTIKTGTPAATPKPPTLTDGRLLLAFVSVAAAAANIQSSNISERRFQGADATVAGTLAARPSAAVGWVGGTYFATDTNGGTLYRSNGTTWVDTGAGVTGTSGASFAIGTTPAATGSIRIPNSTTITARNGANTADVGLFSLNASNLSFTNDNGTARPLNTTIADATGHVTANARYWKAE